MEVTPKENGNSTALRSADLVAAVSYMADITPRGCYYHNWRVALIARQIASLLIPDKQRDVFFAGLFEDLGVIGADKHIIYYPTLHSQISDHHVATHPYRSGALIEWLHCLSGAAHLARCHHELWNGSGYPERRQGAQIPLGSQILALVDAADIAGCFRTEGYVFELLDSMVQYVGRSWPDDVWAALHSILEDTDFCCMVTNDDFLPGLIETAVSEVGLPERLDTEEGIERMLHMIAMLVDNKDPSTHGHSIRTARYAKVLAEAMKLSEEDSHFVYRAGLVHDVGRMGLPTNMLGKAVGLRPDEMELVRKHADMTIRILNCIPNKNAMVQLGLVAGHDHERWDGRGYPHGMAGTQIPNLSRVLTVADAYDVVTNPPSYRQPLSPRAALGRLKLDVRTQFDPDVLEALDIAVKEGSMADVARLAA